MRDKVFRLQSLTGLVICLDERQQAQTISMLADVASEHERLRRLIPLVPDLKPVVRGKILEEALRFTAPEYSKRLADAVDCAEKGGQVLETTPALSFSAGDDRIQLETMLRALVEEGVRDEQMVETESVQEGAPAASQNGVTMLLTNLSRKPHCDRVADLVRTLGNLPRISKVESNILIEQLPSFLRGDRLADALLAALALSPAPDPSIILSAIRHLDNGCDLQRVLASVALRTGSDALPAINEYLHEEFTQGSRQERKHLLRHVTHLIPLIARLGGDLALLQAVEAIGDVGLLWP